MTILAEVNILSVDHIRLKWEDPCEFSHSVHPHMSKSPPMWKRVLNFFLHMWSGERHTFTDCKEGCLLKMQLYHRCKYVSLSHLPALRDYATDCLNCSHLIEKLAYPQLAITQILLYPI